MRFVRANSCFVPRARRGGSVRRSAKSSECAAGGDAGGNLFQEAQRIWCGRGKNYPMLMELTQQLVALPVVTCQVRNVYHKTPPEFR